MKKPDSYYTHEIDEADLLSGDSQKVPYGLEGGVYFVRADKYVKIGFSRSVNSRFRDILRASPLVVVPVAFIKCDHASHALEVERAVHALFEGLRVRGEWFEWNDVIASYVADHAQSWPRAADRRQNGGRGGRRSCD